MKKKIMSIFMVIAITIFNFIPFVNVHAEGGIGQTGTSIVKTDELQKESTVYAGEIFVDGSSQMQWLYSSDISNQQTVFENLKTSLNGTTFADLVPTLDENTDKNGLAVSSSHQSDMNNSWTSANYVANQFYTGTIGTETNGNLYDNNTTYKNNIDTSYSSHQGEVDNPIDFSKRVLSTLSVASDSEIVSIEGVPTRVITITFNLEATTVIYTRVDVTTTPVTKYTVTFDTDRGSSIASQEVAEGQKVTKPSNPTKEGYEFMYWSNADGKNIDDPITANTTFVANWIRKFDITHGADQTFYLESDKDITIVSNGKFSELTGFALFGDNTPSIGMADLTEGTDYILEEGSTKLTLKNSFLKTLGVDKYYVEFYYNGSYGDGYTDTTLLVKSGSEPTTSTEDTTNNLTSGNPQTGDNVMFYISMLGLSIIGLAGVGLYIRKRRFN